MLFVPYQTNPGEMLPYGNFFIDDLGEMAKIFGLSDYNSVPPRQRRLIHGSKTALQAQSMNLYSCGSRLVAVLGLHVHEYPRRVPKKVKANVHHWDSGWGKACKD
jgi:hypothetical protein